MRVVLVIAHPDPASFNHALAACASESLVAAGHEVTVLDLYAEGFRVAMSRDERAAYHSERPIIDPMVEHHAEAVMRADALVFVYPTWWSTMPAILKGWLERVLVPGVGFVFDEEQRVQPGMKHIRHIVGISTYGSPRLYVKALVDNGRRTLHRALRLNTGLLTRRTWLALYGLDQRTADERAAFMHRVERKMRSL